MSKKSKAAAKVKRASEKRARKASQKAQYTAWRDAGVTKGSKRARAMKAKGKKLAKARKGVSGAKPFPVGVWLNKDGTLKAGAPHKAWLALNGR